ncbi:hypothetical protein KDL67_15305, partial [bacterium]|nr:hypothetical protein [bacterium]
MGIGGGGWISATAFHPDNPDYLMIGTDMSGCFYSVDGGANFFPWSEGLDQPDLSSVAGGGSRYVDDLLGIDFGGESGFFAATHAGIYYRGLQDTAWQLQTSDLGYYGDAGLGFLVPGPFSSLAWMGNGFMFAGMGAARYDFGEGNGSPSAGALWYAYLGGGPSLANWVPFPTQPDLNDEPIRDVTAAFGPGGEFLVAVASPAGVQVFLPDGQGSIGWVSVSADTTVWSVELTPRGTLYAAFADPGNEGRHGVFRLPNVLADTDTWVATLDFAAVDRCVEVPYMSLRPGAGPEDDILYVGTRRQKGAPGTCGNEFGHGVYRVSLDGTDCCAASTLQPRVYADSGDLYYLDGADKEKLLPEGWIDFWGLNVECAPALTQTGEERAGVSINAHYFLFDGGTGAWAQSYANDTQATENGSKLWNGRGWHETGVTDLAFTPDNAVVAGALDVGAIKSASGSTFDYSKWLPLFTALDSSERVADFIEAQYVGATDEGVFVSSGSARLHKGEPNGARCYFLRYYPDALGTEWLCEDVGATAGVADPDRMVYNDFAFVDDDHVFVSYQREWDDTLQGAGVMEFIRTHNPEGWAADPRDENLPTGAYVYAFARLLYNPNPALPALWLAKNGGIYRLPDPLDPGSVWEQVDNLGSNYSNCRSIAMSSDGSVIYVGTAGRGTAAGLGRIGTVLKCSNPTDPAGQLVWTDVGRTLDFGFQVPIGVGGGWTPQETADRLIDVEGLAVHPQKSNEIYVGLTSDWSLAPLGVWRSTGMGELWTQYNGDRFDGSGVRTLAFAPLAGQSNYQLIAGLRGQEMYRMGVTHYTNGPGCPYVYTWDGSAFAQDNTLLAPGNRALAGTPDANVVDAYVLQQPLVAREGRLDLQIREFERERSWIDQVGLAAVDHPAGTTLSVGPDGAPRLLDGWLTPAEAATADGADVYALLAHRDGDVFAGQPGDVVELNYALPAGGLPTDGLTVRSEDKQVEEPILPKGAVAGIAVEAFDPVAG